MKLRYLFSMIIASVLLFAGCVKEEPTGSFDNIKLDKTYLVLSENGGTVELTVTATEAWAFDTLYTEDVWPNVITRTKNDAGEYYVSKCEASWLSVDKMSGEAGETVLKFSADSVAGGREIELCIKAGLSSQFLRIRQGSLESVSATCADVIAGPDGKTYKVKGTVTSISNTTYGNWYLNDGTGEIYIYGTLDKDGKTKNFESLGLEVGDVVEVEGPKTTYGTTVELVDVMVLSIEKSLVKVITKDDVIHEKEGGEFDVKVAFKGDGLYPVVADTCKSWVSVVGVKTYAGTPTKIEPSPADTAIVTLALDPFMEKAAPRKGYVTFTSATGKNSTDVVFNITQKGAIPDPTPIKDATKVDEGVCVEGTVVAICSQGYLIADETGVILIYHPETGWENTFVLGDKVKVAADALGAYNFSAQIKNPYFEEKTSEKPATVTYPAPVNYDAAKVAAVVDALAAVVNPADKEKVVALKVEYINMTGKLVIDGKYHNVEIAGSQYQGSLYNPLASLNLADYNGKVVTLGGYFLSISQSSGAFKFINMVVTSVAEAGDVVFPELKFSKTAEKVEPTTTEYTFDITSNLKWTLTASEGVTLDKTSGEGNATVKMTFAANETADAIEHTVTAKAEGAADVTLTVTQATAAAPTEATVAEFLAAEVGSRLFKLTGRVSGIKEGDQYGNFNLVDATGTVYVYGLTATPVSKNDKSFQSLGIKEGDIVTLIGTRAAYTKDGVTTDQVGGPAYYVSHVSHTESTVKNFLDQPVGDAWYKLTGTISNLTNETYGNFDLVDETGSVYVYGLTVAPVAKNDKSFATLGLKEGDTVTLIGTRAAYTKNDVTTDQVGGPAYYVSHVEAVAE